MKRLFDLTLALPIAIATFPLVVALVAASTIDTRSIGLYRQRRIGRNGSNFTVLKIRTMRKTTETQSTITVLADSRITSFGALLRRFKLDEFPQIWLVLTGHMSLVGPRPDVEGYADNLTGGDRAILDLRPGITGPASLVFRDEERLLASFDDPVAANDQVLWPAKVRINLAYRRSASMSDDVRLLLLTLKPDSQKLFELLEGWDNSLTDLGVVEKLRQTSKSVAV